MKTKVTILSAMILALTAISSPLYAAEKGGCHGGGDRSSSGPDGDPSRERGDPSSRGQGELNRDNDTQRGEEMSDAMRTDGHSLGSIAKGSPRDADHQFNRIREETMTHD